MLYADIYRANEYHISITDFFSVTLEQRISSADSLTMDIPGEFDIACEDHIFLYEDNTRVGEFVIDRVETALDENGGRISKVNALAYVAHLLKTSAIPGKDYVKDSTILASIDLIIEAVGAMRRKAIEITLINPVSLDAKVNDEDAATCLDAMTAVLAGTNMRWRCNLDAESPTAIMGTFGTQQDVEFRAGDGTTYPSEYNYSTLTYMESSEDVATDIFCEGGTYVDGAGKQRTILIYNGIGVWGYEVKNAKFADDRSYQWISKTDVDDTDRRWMRVRLSYIAPAQDGIVPTQAQIDSSSQELVDRVIAYMQLMSTPKVTWGIAVPTSHLDLKVGDKVWISASNISDDDKTESVYICSHNISWNADGSVVSDFELSNILDSMADPLQQQFKIESFQKPGREIDGAYSISGASPFTYAFPTGYPTAPIVILTDSGSETWTITSLTATSVTITSTLLGDIVEAWVTPPR